ncbi:DNA-3-methyladenine glycosylase [Ammonicoccus fulvus]|uniref:Putative 3-methyladenine DNA glycosylase n=1 Tax=Ammonicoccus fulvus TaxID=3138240 RepID=A0ABZ3FR67_9ACTN
MSWLDPSTLVTARLLLGAVLRRGPVAVRITEVEAYAAADDPASHAWKGPTRRNAVMFGPPGRLYTYAMHGHTCANVICTPEGVGGGVLLRAGEVVLGLEDARTRRGDVADHRLARGPGNLTRALGITMVDGGAELFDPESPFSLTPGDEEPEISAGPRVGVSRAADVAWRFWITGDPTVSAYRLARAAARDIQPG